MYDSLQVNLPILSSDVNSCTQGSAHSSASFIDGSFAQTAGNNTLFSQLLTFLHSACAYLAA